MDMHSFVTQYWTQNLIQCATSHDVLMFLAAGEQMTLQGLRVLELGCGHGLPGIVALLAGADVTFHVRRPHLDTPALEQASAAQHGIDSFLSS